MHKVNGKLCIYTSHAVYGVADHVRMQGCACVWGGGGGGGSNTPLWICLFVREVGHLRGYPYPVSDGKLAQIFEDKSECRRLGVPLILHSCHQVNERRVGKKLKVAK